MDDHTVDKDFYKELSEDVQLRLQAQDDENDAIHELQQARDHPLIELNLIGEGAIKKIYKCYDPKNKRYVAVARPKELQHYNSFIYEAWVLSSLRHPHIITLHDLDFDRKGRPYYVMALAEGTDLEAYLKTARSLNHKLDLFLDACAAISHAHEQSFVHLDLKPQNILCDSTGHIAICDWGLAEYIKMDGTISINSEEHLHAYADDPSIDKIQGSPGYMAPEQIQTDTPIGVPSDVFALGAILYYLLTGEAPFLGSTEERIKKTKSINHDTLRHALIRQHHDSGLIAIILKSLALEPATRYQSVKDLIADVQLHRDGYTTQAERTSLPLTIRRYTQRHPVRVVMATSFLLIIGIMLSFFTWNDQQKKRVIQQANKDLLTTKQETHSLSNHNRVLQDALSQCPEMQRAAMIVVHNYLCLLHTSDAAYD